VEKIGTQGRLIELRIKHHSGVFLATDEERHRQRNKWLEDDGEWRACCEFRLEVRESWRKWHEVNTAAAASRGKENSNEKQTT
jgi:hypothetical protein